MNGKKIAQKPHSYTMYADSGVDVICDAHTMIGAKREASAWITFGGGSVRVTDNVTGETWEREFWQSLRSFGWESWKRIH